MLAVLTVNSNLDNTIGGDGLTTLREAVIAANQDAIHDKINFDSSLDGGTITLTEGELSITKSVTIDTTDPNNNTVLFDITIDAGGGDDGMIGNGDGFRIFDIGEDDAIDHIDVTLRGLTLTGGDVALGDNGGNGGAIYVGEYTNLTLDDFIIKGNHAAGDGGAIYATYSCAA